MHTKLLKSIAVVFLLAAVCHADDDDHQLEGLSVTQMSFSADSKLLAAAYYKMPQNRPGTDWRAFACVWDLTTGEPTPIKNGAGPIAFSPDGKLLAVCVDERMPRSRLPMSRLTLRRVGEAEPYKILDEPELPAEPERSIDSPVVFAFHPSGSHIAVVTASGTVALWPTSAEGRAKPIGRIDQSAIWGRGGHIGRSGVTITFTNAATLRVAWRRSDSHGTSGWKFDAETGLAELIETKQQPGPAPTEQNPRNAVKPIPAGLLSPDGKLRAMSEPGGTIKITREEDERPIQRLNPALFIDKLQPPKP